MIIAPENKPFPSVKCFQSRKYTASYLSTARAEGLQQIMVRIIERLTNSLLVGQPKQKLPLNSEWGKEAIITVIILMLWLLTTLLKRNQLPHILDR